MVYLYREQCNEYARIASTCHLATRCEYYSRKVLVRGVGGCVAMLSAVSLLLPGSRECRGPTSGTFLGLALPGVFFLASGGGYLLLFAHRLRGAGGGTLLSILTNIDTTERNMSLLHTLGMLVTSATAIGLLVECGGSWLAGCGPFSPHLFPGQELYLAFLLAGLTTLAEGRGLLSLGAHKHALALALSVEGALYLLHSTSFEEPRMAMFRVLAALAFGGGAASLASALHPKVAVFHVCANCFLVGQGAWYFYVAFHLRDPFEHPLRGSNAVVLRATSSSVFIAALALVLPVKIAAAALVALTCRHAKAGAYAFLMSQRAQEDDAELGAQTKGK